MSLDKYIRPFPRVIRIEPSGACNLTCSHCPTGTVKMARGVMKEETFQSVLRCMEGNLDAIQVVVLYHGGEPLLHKGFVDMARTVKELGVPHVKTVSNGMLLNEETIAGIVASNIDMIEFSLDGESPEENNLIRRNCDYDTVVGNIKRLIRYRRKQKSRTPEIFIGSAQFLTKETHHGKDQQPVPPDYLVKEFSGEYAGEIAGFKCLFAMRWPHMEVLEDFYDVYYDPYDTEVKNYCDNVDHTLTVRWNGDVVACCFDLTSDYVLGNVLGEELSTIWNNKRYLDLRRSIDTMQFVPMCANCNTVKPNVYLTLKPEVKDGLGQTGPLGKSN